MGWRTKFVFLLVVYFAGFATAVYSLAPAPEPDDQSSLQAAQVHSALKSEELARAVNSGMHKCIDFRKEAAQEVAKRIREKMEDAKSRSSG